jgi:hypothetical protein
MLWYGPETLEIIAGARCPQEIGSHSYEHVYYGEIDSAAADADLSAAARVHAAQGVGFLSFVFPRNDVGHLDLLAKHGVKVFRSVDQGIHMLARQRLGRLAGRAANFLDKLLPIPPAAVAPVIHENGLVELPSSMLLMSRNGARRAIHPRAAVLKARLGLEAAARSHRVFHLWFHPSNFYYRTREQLHVLGQILARARELRDEGRLDVRTMGTFASSLCT